MTLQDVLSEKDLNRMKEWLKREQKWEKCSHCGEKCILV